VGERLESGDTLGQLYRTSCKVMNTIQEPSCVVLKEGGGLAAWPFKIQLTLSAMPWATGRSEMPH
jgi:hypothetical protein